MQYVVPIASIQRTIRLALIHLDTFILLLRALSARISVLGLSKLFHKAQVPDDISILYLDLGTHKEGAELFFVVDEILPPVCHNVEAYGFEASQASFEHVAKKCADRGDVELMHKALVHVLPGTGTIKLFKGMRSGLGDSLYRQTDQYEEVDAMRLSDFLIERFLVKANTIVLLRMNIEGAEYEVLQDLVAHQLAHAIDGYFGMWDDLYKIDSERDAEFRAFLARHQIRPFTFNGRDLRHPLRRKCIAYHMHTRIMQRLRRI